MTKENKPLVTAETYVLEKHDLDFLEGKGDAFRAEYIKNHAYGQNIDYYQESLMEKHLDYSSYDCEYCGVNIPEISLEVDRNVTPFSFTVETSYGCYGGQRVKDNRIAAIALIEGALSDNLRKAQIRSVTEMKDVVLALDLLDEGSELSYEQMKKY